MTDKGTLDARYLEWLYTLVGPLRNRNPARSHWLLTEQLFKKQFISFVNNDHNRIEDGRDLRLEFLDLDETEPYMVHHWLEEDVSVLEVLIGLSRRLSFETDGEAFYWLWKLLENLDLRVYTDEIYDEDAQEEIDSIITRVIDRTYNFDGSGGVFPLKHADKDQRDVELWYQMSSYLLENGFG